MYSSPNIMIIRSGDQIDRIFSMQGEIGKLCKSSVLNLMDNIKKSPQVLSCDGMYWIELIQGKIQWFAFVNTVNDSFCRSEKFFLDQLSKCACFKILHYGIMVFIHS